MPSWQPHMAGSLQSQDWANRAMAGWGRMGEGLAVAVKEPRGLSGQRCYWWPDHPLAYLWSGDMVQEEMKGQDGSLEK